jgi:predicted phosphodiesterase
MKSLLDFSLSNPSQPGKFNIIQMQDRGDGWTVMGFVADTHLCSKHCRLDVLNSLYDIFKAEGVKDVYHGGNWIEGESRMNRYDISVFGMDNQLDFMIDNYPSRDGIITHYVAGDDHEGWYQQRESIHIGAYLEMRAKKSGRNDLHYLGYLEADVALKAPGTWAAVPMKIMHGGGGATYAYSYVLQKVVEAFQGGEKPSILCVGHHHKFDYNYTREVHAFMPGCTEDQSIFMRKRKIAAHVGGCIAWVQQDKRDGHITRFRIEWIPFYDKAFYETRFD